MGSVAELHALRFTETTCVNCARVRIIERHFDVHHANFACCCDLWQEFGRCIISSRYINDLNGKITEKIVRNLLDNSVEFIRFY